MPAKRKPEPPGKPQITPDVALGLLRTQMGKARHLLESRPLSKDAHSQWELVTSNYLEKAFGVGSPNVSSVADVGRYGSFPMNADDQWWENRRAENLATQVSRLEGLIELLETELQLQVGSGISRPPLAPGSHHRLFLVHGHDEAALNQVARFLELLKQDVVVLREQPNRGQTIIEKFEDYSDVAFAVVLLTPDDRGGSADSDGGDQNLRARQNVILELGYFLGRLGRNRVCSDVSESLGGGS